MIGLCTSKVDSNGAVGALKCYNRFLYQHSSPSCKRHQLLPHAQHSALLLPTTLEEPANPNTPATAKPILSGQGHSKGWHCTEQLFL